MTWRETIIKTWIPPSFEHKCKNCGTTNNPETSKHCGNWHYLTRINENGDKEAKFAFCCSCVDYNCAPKWREAIEKKWVPNKR